jgi:hypothetical protein
VPTPDIRLFDASKGRLVPVLDGSLIDIRTHVPMGVEFESLPLQAARPLVVWRLLERLLEHEGLMGRFVVRPFDGSEALITTPFGDPAARKKHILSGGAGERGGAAESARPSIDLLLPGIEKTETRGEALTHPAQRRSQARSRAAAKTRPGASGEQEAGSGETTAAEWESRLTTSAHSVSEAASRVGYESVLIYLLSVHYADPLERPGRGLLDGWMRASLICDIAHTLARGQPSPSDMSAHLSAFLGALARDLDTPRACSILFNWLHEAKRHRGPVGDSHLREMLTLLSIEDLLNAVPTPRCR